MIGRGIKKLSLSQNVELHLKFLENNTEALVILKMLKFPKDDRTDRILWRRLECISRDIKVPWIA